MTKTLLTIVTPEIADECREFVDNQRGYAAALGYNYVVQDKVHWEHLHPSFSKVWEISEALAAGNDFVIWADADVAFMDYSVDLAGLLRPDEFMAAYQQTNWPKFPYLCAGLTVWRNCPQAVSFVAEWKSKCEQTETGFHPWEQWGLSELTQASNCANIRCCNAYEIGCFCPQLWHDGTLWRDGMPTMHFAGTSTWARRREVFLKHYQHLVKK